MARTRLLPLAVALALRPISPASAQDAEAGRGKVAECAACHGADGNSTNPEFPILAGQTFRYTYLQLKDYKEGRRSDPQMTPFVANLSRDDMLDIAAFYAAQKPSPISSKADAAKVQKGRAKAAEALCTMCHLGGFKGQNEIPRVAGQYYEYIVKQMKDFKTGQRTNDAGTMSAVSKTLSTEDVDALAQYLANLD
ncbi:MAG TPA: c-type cytochrome [Anaeromyxobacter sp.]